MARDGTVVLNQLVLTVGSSTFVFGSGAAHFETTQFLELPGCIPTVVNNCLFKRCAGAQLDAGSYLTTAENAGVVTISGAKVPLSLTVGSDGGYTPLSNIVQMWDGGEVLSVSATGGTVPAFGGETVVAPSILTLTAPTCTGSTCQVFDRVTPLTVSWTGGTYGTVWVALTTSVPGHDVQFVECWFPASGGSGTIGTDMLSNLNTTPDGGVGVFDVWNQSSTMFDAGGFQVEFLTRNDVASAQLVVH